MRAEDKVLLSFFEERLTHLDVRDDTRSYVLAILSDVRREGCDLSRQSLTLVYKDAIDRGDFIVFRKLGDYVLFAECFAPESLKERELAQTLGRRSYQTCWRLMRGQWECFDELADRLPEIGSVVRSVIRR